MSTQNTINTSTVRANNDIASKLSDSLPVQLTAKDVENYPELINLLSSLSQNISQDGTTIIDRKELQEAQETLQHEKLKWLQQHIIYTELQEMLLDHELDSSLTTSTNSQFYKAVRECLTFSEIGDYLHCHPDPSSDVTLLGLKSGDIEKANPHSQHLPSIQQKLIPELEQRLRKKCETLINFYDTSSSSGDRLMFAKASQLPTMIEAGKHALQDEKKQLRRAKLAREKQFWHYYQVLMDSLSILEKLITRHRLQSQSDSDTITSEWLTARCDAMCLKIKILELQLQCDTYYSHTVQALTAIRNQLDLNIHDTQQELRMVSQSLTAYEAVGSDFDTVVHDYTVLKDEVENKRWALRELKHSVESPCDGFEEY